MGFWDSLTGKAASSTMSRLTDAQNGWLQQGVNAVNSTYDNGLEALNQGTQAAMDTAKGYSQEAQTYLGQGYNQARNDVRTNTDQGINYLYGAIEGMQPYATNGANASNMYSNAIGLNGAEGNTAATNAFKTSPGYQWQVDQATDAAARKASSLGMAASGNTLTGLATLGSNLADQEYSDWLDRLYGQQSVGLQAQTQIGNYAGQQATLAANAGNTLGNLSSTYGQNAANIQSNLGTQLGNWQYGLGTSTNQSWQNRGNQLSNLTADHSKTIANNYNNAAQATAAGAQNIFGTGMGLVTGGLTKLGAIA